MRRTLLSSQKACAFKCAYCFALKQDYQYRASCLVGLSKSKVDILYPFCDVEIDIKENFGFLKELSECGKAISISTKSIISLKDIEDLNYINNILKKKGTFLKVGIPITTKSKLAEIERGTADYDERIHNLGKLKRAGIHSSLVLKPILPFVPISEYEEIIDAAIRYTCHFLLGGLYIDKSSDFYRDYLSTYKTVKRKVEWLSEKPEWDYIDSKEIIVHLRKYIFQIGGLWFESDIDLLQDISVKFANSQLAEDAVSLKSNSLAPV